MSDPLETQYDNSSIEYKNRNDQETSIEMRNSLVDIQSKEQDTPYQCSNSDLQEYCVEDDF